MEYRVYFEGYKIVEADCNEEAQEFMLGDLTLGIGSEECEITECEEIE